MTTTKTINNCKLEISKTTCWRTLHRIGYKCRKAAPQIMLTKKHKEARLTAIRSGFQNAMIGTKQFSVTRRDSPLMVLITGAHMLKNNPHSIIPISTDLYDAVKNTFNRLSLSIIGYN